MKHALKITTLVLLFAFLASCKGAGSLPPSSAYQFPPLTTRDVCGNRYYPVAEGAAWQYLAKDGSGNTSGTMYSISNVVLTDTGATFVQNIDGEAINDMSCTNGDINSIYSVILASYPPDINSDKLPYIGNLTYFYEGEETVSVPAGTFECTIVCRYNNNSSDGDCWYYAPGVGPVQNQFFIDGEVYTSLQLVAYSVP